jgi:hypothetical protein
MPRMDGLEATSEIRHQQRRQQRGRGLHARPPRRRP